MADIARPALAEVLAALTHEHGSAFDVAWWRVNGIRSGRPFGTHGPISREGYGCVPWLTTPASYEARRVGNALTRVEVAPAHTITPAEAVEAIAGLWPWPVGDDAAPRWWCERCDGEGVVRARGPFGYVDCLDCAVMCDASPTGAQGLGHTAATPTLAALVAIASLGAPQLARYVHLASEIARAAGCEGARVVWRVMGREAIEKHHERTAQNAFIGNAGMMCAFFSGWTRGEWQEPEACPVDVGPLAAAWPALRSLAVGDEATPWPTGVHLVALDAVRIVLAVEAIGGDRG